MAISSRRRLAFRSVAAASRAAAPPNVQTGSPRLGKRTSKAFTLVELLVVITIIGMLIALLLPAIQGARARGWQVDCMNNMRQLGTAAISYESSRGQLPGYTQFIKRGNLNGNTEYAQIVGYDSTERRFKVGSIAPKQPYKAGDLDPVSAFSWATMLLPRIERTDVWDGIVQPPVAQGEVVMPPIATFVCVADRDVATQPDLAGLSYVMNTGAWDRDGSGNFKGDTVDNGIALSVADFDRKFVKAPVVRIGAIKDGAGTTLLFSENIHKSYEPTAASGSAPAFSWLAGNEQQLGMVWVVPTSGTAPSPGNTINDQEALNRADAATFPADFPRYARPSSAHSNGMNVIFCDNHGMFLRDNIDYVVYQQLMTPNGRKCDDPANPRGPNTQSLPASDPIKLFRIAPPLAEKDYN